jgi:hypothetical protein
VGICKNHKSSGGISEVSSKKKKRKRYEASRRRQCEGKKEVMLRVFWEKVKYIEGIFGIEILLCRIEGKNERKKKEGKKNKKKSLK